jgi:CHAD domain-containing protein
MATAAPGRHLEIETKLEIDPAASLDDLARDKQLRAAGVTGVDEPEQFDLDAVYYDTDDLRLLEAKLTLRRRTGGKDAGWHLKLPAAAGARTEIGLPLTADANEPVPAALVDLTAGAARGRALRPVARVRNARVVRLLRDGAGTELVEVADDHVTATAIDATGTESEPASWRELEAEIVDGTRDHLAAAVAALTKRGASPASSASKLARALQETGALPAPATGRKKEKDKDRTAGRALHIALERLQAGLVATDRAVREGTPTSLHDARAAVRRLRSVLTVYRPLLDEEQVDDVRDRLAGYGRQLGAARDLEVVHERLFAQLDDEPAEYAAAARSRLDEEFGRRVPAARAEVLQTLHDQEYFDMLGAVDALLADPRLTKRAARPAAAEFPVLLGAAWRRLTDHVAEALADPENSPAVHVVRRRAKALRYATEAAIPAVGDPAALFASALEEIQEVLGEYQDASTSAVLLAELALDEATDGTAGFVFGRLHAFEQAAAHGCLDDFADAWDRVQDGELVENLGG